MDLQEQWRTDLRRRVQRIARGHPDPGMRAEVDRIGEATIRALHGAFEYINHYHQHDDEELLKIFEGEIMPAVRSYVRCLHGKDENADEQSVSTLRRIRDTYRATGVLLRPSEISG